MKKQVLIFWRIHGTKLKSLVFKLDNFDDYFKFADDEYDIVRMGIGFGRQFIHIKLFHDEVQKLFESGITELEAPKFNDGRGNTKGYNPYSKITKIIKTEIELKVLTFEDLKAGFIIWLVAVLASSIMVFIFEIVYFKMKNNQVCCKPIENNEKLVKTDSMQLIDTHHVEIHCNTIENDLKWIEIDEI